MCLRHPDRRTARLSCLTPAGSESFIAHILCHVYVSTQPCHSSPDLVGSTGICLEAHTPSGEITTEASRLAQATQSAFFCSTQPGGRAAGRAACLPVLARGLTAGTGPRVSLVWVSAHGRICGSPTPVPPVGLLKSVYTYTSLLIS